MKEILIMAVIAISVVAATIYFGFGFNSRNSAPTPVVSNIENDTETPQIPDNLKIEDTQVGSGSAVKSGDTISMHYTGYLEDGTKFDSSVDRGTPFETQIGVGQVIKGWDLGVVGMKVGGKRKLTIPSELGYGEQGSGPIPPNSTLIFELELLEIK